MESACIDLTWLDVTDLKCTELNAIGLYWIEWIGLNGLDWIVLNSTCRIKSKLKRIALKRIDLTWPESIGLGLTWIESNWIALTWIGPDSMDWSEIAWIGLNWIDFYCIDLHCIAKNISWNELNVLDLACIDSTWAEVKSICMSELGWAALIGYGLHRIGLNWVAWKSIELN